MLNRAMTTTRIKHITLLALIGLALAPAAAWAAPGGAASAARGRGYTNLSIAVYFRYQEVKSTPDNLAQFATSWANVEKQVRVDKVYLETTRNRQLATEAAVTTMKAFFQDRGIKVSAGQGLTVQESAGSQGTGAGGGRAGRGNFGGFSGVSFDAAVPGHSFRVFAVESR